MRGRRLLGYTHLAVSKSAKTPSGGGAAAPRGIGQNSYRSSVMTNLHLPDLTFMLSRM